MRKQLIEKLETIQKRARVRTMDAEEVERYAGEIALFLASAPNGTSVKKTTCPRVASSYTGIPETTFVHGQRDEAGIVTLSVGRGRDGFGAREWYVSSPDHHVHGEGVHCGAADDLDTVEID